MGDVKEIENPPFAVLFPGQRRHSKDAPYNFRHSVDPRLGSAQRRIKAGLLPNPDDYSLDDLPPPPPPPPSNKPKKRKLKDIYGGSECPSHCPVTRMDGSVVSQEDVEWIAKARAKAREDYASKEYHVKYLLRYKQGIKDWIENEENIYRARDIGCAKAAMEFYNKKHDTDYEIVETLGSYMKPFNGALYHCNFRAQRKGVTSSGSCPSPKLFFAELLNFLTPDGVKLCVILNDPDPCHPLPLGCHICPGHLWHPSDFRICSWL